MPAPTPPSGTPATPPAPAVNTPAITNTAAARLSHAVHNREVCDLLTKDGRFSDWVVTTAFYAAMHRVQAHVFPYNDGTRTYVNIGQYASSISSGSNRVSKHEATKRIVRQVLPTVSNKYSRLFDICYTARYVQYQTAPEIAVLARNCLEAIEQACV